MEKTFQSGEKLQLENLFDMNEYRSWCSGPDDMSGRSYEWLDECSGCLEREAGEGWMV